MLLCRQDIWHARMRIERELEKRHPDFKKAVADLKGVYRRVNHKRGEQPPDLISTHAQFKAAMLEWQRQYSKRLPQPETAKDKIMRLADELVGVTGDADTRQVGN